MIVGHFTTKNTTLDIIKSQELWMNTFRNSRDSLEVGPLLEFHLHNELKKSRPDLEEALAAVVGIIERTRYISFTMDSKGKKSYENSAMWQNFAIKRGDCLLLNLNSDIKQDELYKNNSIPKGYKLVCKEIEYVKRPLVEYTDRLIKRLSPISKSKSIDFEKALEVATEIMTEKECTFGHENEIRVLLTPECNIYDGSRLKSNRIKSLDHLDNIAGCGVPLKPDERFKLKLYNKRIVVYTKHERHKDGDKHPYGEHPYPYPYKMFTYDDEGTYLQCKLESTSKNDADLMQELLLSRDGHLSHNFRLWYDDASGQFLCGNRP